MTSLPIGMYERQFKQVLKSPLPIFLVVASTGSGKSTQLPRYCAEYIRDRYMLGSVGHLKASQCISLSQFDRQYRPDVTFESNLFNLVVVSQPNNLASLAIARRVAYEYELPYHDQLLQDPKYGYLGHRVGLITSVECIYNPRTCHILFITDHCLVDVMARDPHLGNTSVLIVDEAHERSLYSDVIMSLAKLVCKQRKNFKLIISSATVDSGRFLQFLYDYDETTMKLDYFERQYGEAVLLFQARNYDVRVAYHPIRLFRELPDGFTPQLLTMSGDADGEESINHQNNDQQDIQQNGGSVSRARRANNNDHGHDHDEDDDEDDESSSDSSDQLTTSKGDHPPRGTSSTRGTSSDDSTESQTTQSELDYRNETEEEYYSTTLIPVIVSSLLKHRGGDAMVFLRDRSAVNILYSTLTTALDPAIGGGIRDPTTGIRLTNQHVEIVELHGDIPPSQREEIIHDANIRLQRQINKTTRGNPHAPQVIPQAPSTGGGLSQQAMKDIATRTMARQAILSSTASSNAVATPSQMGLGGAALQPTTRATTTKRIVYLCDAIAETSITLPVKLVIDTGRVTVQRFDINRRLTVYEDEFITQDRSDQRKGRAGRIDKGVCIRLYKQEDLVKKHTVAEIQRVALDKVALLLCSMKLNPLSLSLVDPPNPNQFRFAVEQLLDYQCLLPPQPTGAKGDGSAILTPVPVTPSKQHTPSALSLSSASVVPPSSRTSSVSSSSLAPLVSHSKTPLAPVQTANYPSTQQQKPSNRQHTTLTQQQQHLVNNRAQNNPPILHPANLTTPTAILPSSGSSTTAATTTLANTTQSSSSSTTRFSAGGSGSQDVVFTSRRPKATAHHQLPLAPVRYKMMQSDAASNVPVITPKGRLFLALPFDPDMAQVLFVAAALGPQPLLIMHEITSLIKHVGYKHAAETTLVALESYLKVLQQHAVQWIRQERKLKAVTATTTAATQMALPSTNAGDTDDDDPDVDIDTILQSYPLCATQSATSSSHDHSDFSNPCVKYAMYMQMYDLILQSQSDLLLLFFFYRQYVYCYDQGCPHGCYASNRIASTLQELELAPNIPLDFNATAAATSSTATATGVAASKTKNNSTTATTTTSATTPSSLYPNTTGNDVLNVILTQQQHHPFATTACRQEFCRQFHLSFDALGQVLEVVHSTRQYLGYFIDYFRVYPFKQLSVTLPQSVQLPSSSSSSSQTTTTTSTSTTTTSTISTLSLTTPSAAASGTPAAVSASPGGFLYNNASSTSLLPSIELVAALPLLSPLVSFSFYHAVPHLISVPLLPRVLSRGAILAYPWIGLLKSHISTTSAAPAFAQRADVGMPPFLSLAVREHQQTYYISLLHPLVDTTWFPTDLKAKLTETTRLITMNETHIITNVGHRVWAEVEYQVREITARDMRFQHETRVLLQSKKAIQGSSAHGQQTSTPSSSSSSTTTTTTATTTTPKTIVHSGKTIDPSIDGNDDVWSRFTGLDLRQTPLGYIVIVTNLNQHANAAIERITQLIKNSTALKNKSCKFTLLGSHHFLITFNSNGVAVKFRPQKRRGLFQAYPGVYGGGSGRGKGAYYRSSARQQQQQQQQQQLIDSRSSGDAAGGGMEPPSEDVHARHPSRGAHGGATSLPPNKHQSIVGQEDKNNKNKSTSLVHSPNGKDFGNISASNGEDQSRNSPDTDTTSSHGETRRDIPASTILIPCQHLLPDMTDKTNDTHHSNHSGYHIRTSPSASDVEKTPLLLPYDHLSYTKIRGDQWHSGFAKGKELSPLLTRSHIVMDNTNAFTFHFTFDGVNDFSSTKQQQQQQQQSPATSTLNTTVGVTVSTAAPGSSHHSLDNSDFLPRLLYGNITGVLERCSAQLKALELLQEVVNMIIERHNHDLQVKQKRQGKSSKTASKQPAHVPTSTNASTGSTGSAVSGSVVGSTASSRDDDDGDYDDDTDHDDTEEMAIRPLRLIPKHRGGKTSSSSYHSTMATDTSHASRTRGKHLPTQGYSVGKARSDSDGASSLSLSSSSSSYPFLDACYDGSIAILAIPSSHVTQLATSHPCIGKLLQMHGEPIPQQTINHAVSLGSLKRAQIIDVIGKRLSPLSMSDCDHDHVQSGGARQSNTQPHHHNHQASTTVTPPQPPPPQPLPPPQRDNSRGELDLVSLGQIATSVLVHTTPHEVVFSAMSLQQQQQQQQQQNAHPAHYERLYLQSYTSPDDIGDAAAAAGVQQPHGYTYYKISTLPHIIAVHDHLIHHGIHHKLDVFSNIGLRFTSPHTATLLKCLPMNVQLTGYIHSLVQQYTQNHLHLPLRDCLITVVKYMGDMVQQIESGGGSQDSSTPQQQLQQLQQQQPPQQQQQTHHHRKPPYLSGPPFQNRRHMKSSTTTTSSTTSSATIPVPTTTVVIPPSCPPVGLFSILGTTYHPLDLLKLNDDSPATWNAVITAWRTYLSNPIPENIPLDYMHNMNEFQIDQTYARTVRQLVEFPLVYRHQHMITSAAAVAQQGAPGGGHDDASGGIPSTFTTSNHKGQSDVDGNDDTLNDSDNIKTDNTMCEDADDAMIITLPPPATTEDTNDQSGSELKPVSTNTTTSTSTTAVCDSDHSTGNDRISTSTPEDEEQTSASSTPSIIQPLTPVPPSTVSAVSYSPAPLSPGHIATAASTTGLTASAATTMSTATTTTTTGSGSTTAGGVSSPYTAHIATRSIGRYIRAIAIQNSQVYELSDIITTLLHDHPNVQYNGHHHVTTPHPEFQECLTTTTTVELSCPSLVTLDRVTQLLTRATAPSHINTGLLTNDLNYCIGQLLSEKKMGHFFQQQNVVAYYSQLSETDDAVLTLYGNPQAVQTGITALTEYAHDRSTLRCFLTELSEPFWHEAHDLLRKKIIHELRDAKCKVSVNHGISIEFTHPHDKDVITKFRKDFLKLNEFCGGGNVLNVSKLTCIRCHNTPLSRDVCRLPKCGHVICQTCLYSITLNAVKRGHLPVCPRSGDPHRGTEMIDNAIASDILTRSSLTTPVKETMCCDHDISPADLKLLLASNQWQTVLSILSAPLFTTHPKYTVCPNENCLFATQRVFAYSQCPGCGLHYCAECHVENDIIHAFLPCDVYRLYRVFITPIFETIKRDYVVLQANRVYEVELQEATRQQEERLKEIDYWYQQELKTRRIIQDFLLRKAEEFLAKDFPEQALASNLKPDVPIIRHINPIVGNTPAWIRFMNGLLYITQDIQELDPRLPPTAPIPLCGETDHIFDCLQDLFKHHTANIKFSYHGTRSENLGPILSQGLDPSYRGRNGQAYGIGEYTSMKITTAKDYSLQSADVLLCLVIKIHNTHQGYCYVTNNPVDFHASYVLPIGVISVTSKHQSDNDSDAHQHKHHPKYDITDEYRQDMSIDDALLYIESRQLAYAVKFQLDPSVLIPLVPLNFPILQQQQQNSIIQQSTSDDDS